MVTPPDIEAQILRYLPRRRSGRSAPSPGSCTCITASSAACWRRPVCRGIGPPPRQSRIDPYLPFIRQTLETFPTLTASRLYVMVRERGYRGSPDHFRHLIACHRPRPKAEAYLRLRTPARRAGDRSTGDISAISRSAARGVR